MKTRSYLQRRTAESSDRLTARIQPRPFEASQFDQSQPPGHDFSHVDLFSHTPSRNGVQAKLTVGAANDQYEQEADRVADQVMSMPDSASQQPVQREMAPEEDEKALQTKPLVTTITPLLQRQAMPEEEAMPEEQEEPVQAKLIQRQAMPEEEAMPEEQEESVQAKLIQRQAMPEEEAMPEEQEEPVQAKLIQRQAMPEEEAMPEEQEEPVQTKSVLQRSSEAGSPASSNLESQLSSSQGGGSQLPEEVRSFMEPRFGADFSQVRVHTDGEAVQMNRDLQAQAFTHKQDIYFGAGYAPGKNALTAHELTHVVQQTSNERIATQIQKQPTQPAISTPLGKGVKFAQDGSAELKAGAVTVVVLPDQVSDTLSNEESSGETKFNLEGGDAPGYEFNGKGLITKIDPIPPIKVTIQTTYRTGVSPNDQSAYGKGTTKEDIKAGNTSLKYHEGSHGSDYINYLKTHPLPTFKGTKGMTEAQFQKAQQDYIKAIEKYREAMDAYSEAHTDCVGTKGKFCQ